MTCAAKRRRIGNRAIHRRPVAERNEQKRDPARDDLDGQIVKYEWDFDYDGTFDGLYMSKDAGDNWVRVFAPLPTDPPYFFTDFGGTHHDTGFAYEPKGRMWRRLPDGPLTGRSSAARRA